MAEIGLVPFAHLALEVATAVLPRSRTRFSKHQFTPPQLLAILCRMRCEDWTFREAEVRLREHRELRRAWGLHVVPDHITMCRFLCRLPEESIGRALAPTGWGAISSFFVRRMHPHSQRPLPWRHGLKWLVVADLDQRLLLGLQPLPVVASLLASEDANRAKRSHNSH